MDSLFTSAISCAFLHLNLATISTDKTRFRKSIAFPALFSSAPQQRPYSADLRCTLKSANTPLEASVQWTSPPVWVLRVVQLLIRTSKVERRRPCGWPPPSPSLKTCLGVPAFEGNIIIICIWSRSSLAKAPCWVLCAKGSAVWMNTLRARQHFWLFRENRITLENPRRKKT